MRPVEDVIQEWLADCADRIEAEEEETRARKATTAAMRWTAFYADKREKLDTVDDAPETARAYAARHDEQSVEVQLAID